MTYRTAARWIARLTRLAMLSMTSGAWALAFASTARRAGGRPGAVRDIVGRDLRRRLPGRARCISTGGFRPTGHRTFRAARLCGFPRSAIVFSDRRVRDQPRESRRLL